MKKKKIVILYEFYSEEGGVERIIKFQANTLKKVDYEVTFGFAYINKELVNKKLSDFEVFEYGKLPIKNELFQIFSTLFRNDSLMFFNDCDLIICHSFPASYFAYRIFKKYKTPYILHLHHPPQFLYNTQLSWAFNTPKRFIAYLIGKIFSYPVKLLDKFCIKNAKGYILECESVARVIKNTYNVSGKIAYPAVNTAFKLVKDPKLTENYRNLINKPFILGSGRIIRQKRFDYLIDAFSKLSNKSNLQLILAGAYDNKEKQRLEKYAEKKDVKIVFLGSVPLNDLIILYNLASVTVLTCPEEWFGLVPPEAFACGCPVVAWKDNFGPEETVIPGINGYLAKPYDTKDMAEKIQNSLNKKWDKKLILHSVEKFSEEKLGSLFIKYVEKFLFKKN